jgi:Glycosyl hydrolases family 28
MTIPLRRSRGKGSPCFLAFLCCTLFAQSASAATAVNRLVVYPVTEGMPRNNDFTVKVRTPGKNWQELPVYLVKVAQGVDTRSPAPKAEELKSTQGDHQGRATSMGPLDSSIASFDFSGSVDVAVTYNRGNVESARIRPLSYAIASSVKANTITFSLTQPRNISIEVNGDIFHNLQLFADPIEATRPNPTDPNVIYYGPGIHEIGRMDVPSGKTVYLAGGALVEGAFLINHAENVRIAGRGILAQSSAAPGAGWPNQPRSQDPSLPHGVTPLQSSTPPQPMRSGRRDAILIEYSKNIEVDGIIEVPNSYTVLIGQSDNVTIKNIKSFSAGGNNDGIDVFTSSNVLIDSVFMRNSDDNIAIYGHRWNYYGNTKNVTVRNSTLWADVAHPILVGTHGDTDHPDMLEDLKFLNIDIVDQREPQLDYQGCMSLNSGDGNLIRDVRFEDIRIEDIRMGQLVNLRVFFNKKYNTSPGRGIENVLFKDITYNGTHANPSVIAGYDDSREVKNIVFENLKINGRVISDDMPGKPGFFKTGDMANIFVGEHVEGLVFRTGSPVMPGGNNPSH